MKNPNVYWSLVHHDRWSLHVAASPEGMLFVGSDGQPFDELSRWVAARCPGSALIRDDGRLRPYADELVDYLRGVRRVFSVPLDLRGTAFQQTVWQALAAIQYGETRTYSDIAGAIGRPAAVRAVGAAIGANPAMIAVPCHRVIGKNGKLTGFRGGLEMKEKLLRLERDGERFGEEERRPMRDVSFAR